MPKQPQDEKALVPMAEYTALTIRGDELRQVLADNLGPRGIRPLDLDRVRVPAGGGLTWLVPSLSGDEEAKAIEGIVIYWKEPRAYWQTGLDQGGGGTPPDCSSDDGIIGVGTPGGYCASCPSAEWGSSPKGARGQACKQMRFIFLIRPDDMLPLLLVAPPTSIKAISKYFLRLVGKGYPHYGVVSRFTLERAQNATGIAYSRITASLMPNGILDEPTRAAVKAYADAIIPALRFVSVAPDDYPIATEEATQAEVFD